MRVGVVIDRFDPQLGGAEQWTWQFVQSLLRAGHESHVFAKSFANTPETQKLVRHELPRASSRIALAKAAQQAIGRVSLDMVHDMGLGWRCNVFQPHGGSRRASFEQNLLLQPWWLRSAKRRVSTWLPRYREFQQLLEKQYADDGRLIIALSKMTAAHMQRHHGVSAQRIRLIYNGVDLRRFSPSLRAEHRQAMRQRLDVQAHELLLLIVAHNFRLKGVPTLLRAVAQLGVQRQPVRLVVAGGKNVRKYETAARRLGAGDAVTFVGPVEDPTPLYAAADLYVQPTLYDPCSLVVLEALACGLPVITTRFNGAGELITEGVQGHVLEDPFDAAALAERVAPFQDRQLRERAGCAARQLAEAHSLERNCRQIIDVYREQMQTRREAA